MACMKPIVGPVGAAAGAGAGAGAWPRSSTGSRRAVSPRTKAAKGRISWLLSDVRPDPGGPGLLAFFGAGGAQNILQPVVALVAGVLERRLRLVVGEMHGERPWARPGPRIVEGDRPFQRVRPERREALDHPEL